MAYTRRQYKGNSSYSDALLSGITAGSTAITLKDGTTFPDGSVGPFVVTIDAGTATEEKVLVTTRSGANLQNCTRGYDGTTGAAHSANAGVLHTVSAVDLDEANQTAHQLLGGSSTAGQIPYVTGAGTYGFVAAPAANQILVYVAGVPGWSSSPQVSALGVNVTPGAAGTLKTANSTLDDGTGALTAGGTVSAGGTTIHFVDNDSHTWESTGTGTLMFRNKWNNGTGWQFGAGASGNTLVATLNGSGQFSPAGQIFPAAETLVPQSSGGILHSTGVPSNSNGNNNDWCISDNGHLYFKATGAWVQKI